MLRRIERVFWTLVYLRPVQLWGRVAFLVKRRFVRVPGIGGVAVEARIMRDALEKPEGGAIPFTFLSETREYPADAVDWEPLRSSGTGKGVPVKLWRYHLQYFDWLQREPSAMDPGLARYLILDWMARCADDLTEPWEPYPVSRRLRAWVRWLRREAASVAGGAFLELVRRSVITQIRRLELDLEVHLQANHLLENRLALVIALAWLVETAESDVARFTRSLAGHAEALTREIQAQILPDGGHEERSPMYHREMMEGIAEASTAVQRLEAGPGRAAAEDACAGLLGVCGTVLPKMRAWLETLSHPDGRIAQFHDAALGGGVEKNTAEYSSDTDIWLPDSGYFVSRRRDGAFVALCAHAPSPPHQPGHAHGDLGSFELSLQGCRVIVDTGTGSYQDPVVRRLCRSTGAHNVPMIEGSEQSDMWGDFRVGRRALVQGRRQVADGFELGWRDMNGNAFLRRVAWEQGALTIVDRLVVRKKPGRFVSLLHLAPGLTPEPGQPFRICRDGRPFCRLTADALVTIEPSVYYPDFGTGHPTFALRLDAGDFDEISCTIAPEP
ncbi:MAG TPA: alginate lyase family protein [Candidatus Ozemobacteraceae bacterium]|nr:alginate lyase family protein [Candidatus Ozemobacteraceae bacterium]